THGARHRRRHPSSECENRRQRASAVNKRYGIRGELGGWTVMKKSKSDRKNESLNFLAGGGEMGERIRHFDWSRTPLGPIEHWPQSLKTAARIMLGSRYQMFIWWGDELINLYNDAYAPLLGQRHPSALGQRAEPLWPEIWPVVGPQTQTVLRENRATWND